MKLLCFLKWTSLSLSLSLPLSLSLSCRKETASNKTLSKLRNLC
jgi:hypothetical protein